MKLAVLIIPWLLYAGDVSVEQLFNVQTLKVQRIHTAITQKNYGYVRADEARIYDVVPRFGGYVEHLRADTLYKKVTSGELLATIYSPEVYRAKEDYINALRFDRKRANKSMSRSAKAKLELLGVPAKEIAALGPNTAPSRLTRLYAPQSGYIFAKRINKGSAFNAKEMLFRIVNLDTVWVEAAWHQKELPLLHQFQTFRVNAEGIDKEFNATNVMLYPKIDPKEATATLRLRVDNPQHLLQDGMYVRVKSYAQEQNYLTLPVTAVIRKNGRFYAFVTGEYEGEYEPVEIHVTMLDRNTYRIIEGLQEGDEVVNNALFMMDSDAQINGLY